MLARLIFAASIVSMTACGGKPDKKAAPGLKPQAGQLTDVSSCTGDIPSGLTIQSHDWVSKNKLPNGSVAEDRLTITAAKMFVVSNVSFATDRDYGLLRAKVALSAGKIKVTSTDVVEASVDMGNGTGSWYSFNADDGDEMTYRFIGPCMELTTKQGNVMIFVQP